MTQLNLLATGALAMAAEKHVVALLENSSATLVTMDILFAIQGGKEDPFYQKCKKRLAWLAR